jgi:hypothetical protein
MRSSSWASLRSWHSALSSERAPWRRSMSRPFRPRLPTSGPSPLWTAVRGAGLARLRLAPAAAWPLDRAPAPALGPANATPVRHGHGLRNVLLGPHRTRLHHTVGLQQYRGSALMAILTHATWNTFYSAASWRSSPPHLEHAGYSSNLVEGKFCELRDDGVLGRSL